MNVNGIGKNNIWIAKYKELLEDGKKLRFLTGGRYQGKSVYIDWLRKEVKEK